MPGYYNFYRDECIDSNNELCRNVLEWFRRLPRELDVLAEMCEKCGLMKTRDAIIKMKKRVESGEINWSYVEDIESMLVEELAEKLDRCVSIK